MQKTLLIFIGLSSILFSDVKLVNKTSLNGLEYTTKHNISISQCATICESNKACKGLNYRLSSKRCGLLKSYTSRIDITGIVSGVNYSDFNRKLGLFHSQIIKKPKPIVQQKPKPIVQQKPKPVVQQNPKPAIQQNPKPAVQQKPKPIIKQKTQVIQRPKQDNQLVKGLESGLSSIGGFFSSTFSSVKSSVNSLSVNDKRTPSKNNIYNSPEIIGDTQKETPRANNYGIPKSKIAPIEEETISTIEEETISTIKEETPQITSTYIKENTLKKQKSSNSIVTEFSNSPIKNIYNCKLYERKSNKLIINKKCEMRKYFFDDKTKLSINFINGSPFRFIKQTNGELIYLNQKERETAYFSEYNDRGELLFDIYRLTYEK